MDRAKAKASEQRSRLTLRLPADLAEKVKGEAEAGHRPLNAQLILLIERGLNRAGATGPVEHGRA